MRPLFEAVRSEATDSSWSRGIELARRDGVIGVDSSETEVVLRVTTRGGLSSPTVHLYPPDLEWDCDCPGPDDPCVHVAAAVIALQRSTESGGDLFSGPSRLGHIGYRFTRDGKALEFDRVVVRRTDAGEEEVALPASLAAIASGRVDGPEFAASDEDQRVEQVLGPRLRGVMPRPILSSLLAALAQCADVRLDDEPIRCSADEVLPVAVVRDQGIGFELILRRDPRVRAMFRGGLALCGDTLQPIGEAKLTHRERQELLQGRLFTPEQVGQLVGEVLPGLARRLPVDVRTKRLPTTRQTPPYIRLEVERRADTLRVLPSIVYGDPPTARVEGDRLIHLGGPVPVRDERTERRLTQELRQDMELSAGWPTTLGPGDAIAFRERLESFEGQIAGDAHEQFFEAPPLEARLEVDADRFDLAFESERGGRRLRADPARALQAWSSGEQLVPLLDGGFARPPESWLRQHSRLLSDLLAARDAAGAADGALPACSLPDLARLCDELGEPAPPGLEKLRVLLEDFDELPQAELPSDLHGELRPYQAIGINWLGFLREAGLGGLLADDMGLGKTLQMLCALRGRTLVVCPTSVVYGWQEQIERFRPDLSHAVYHGPGRELDPDAQVTLTTYALLRLDVEKLCAVDWDTAVLDEAQAIKNPDSQVARCAYQLKADFRVTLTGTPIENRLDELWSQIHFTNPGLLGSRKDFRRRYAQPVAAGEPGAAAHLRSRIKPFVLRRMKSEVEKDLPPRTEAVLHCELEADERTLYDVVRASTREDVVERLRAGGGVLEALEALLRLRQAACHPSLVPGQSGETSSKVRVLLEALEEVVAEDHKALVFSQWTSLLDLVEPHLREAGIPFLRLDGSTRDRAGVVRAFQEDDGAPLLLISLRAGGTGLNLTAADHVFLLDPWWNPAVEDQAADRAHRIGQTRPVSVYRLVARDTVEERILELQSRKRELAEAALGEADRAASVTREELLSLLE